LKGGPSQSDVRLYVEFHNYTNSTSEDKQKQWTVNKTIFSKDLPIH
jgi:hypothetical protein